MKLPWFRLNKRRVGWVPVSYIGWLLTFGFITFTVYNYIRIEKLSNSIPDAFIIFIPQTLLFTGLFSVLCYFTSDKNSGQDLL